ncbi:capsid protein [Streptococcus pneumoniae]|nr:capsid protein [Streptococcus pneumoniae]
MKEKKPIKLNDQQLMLQASNVSDLYHQLSNDLFDNVVDRLKERGTYYLDKQPYLWQLEKMNSIGMLNDRNVELIAEYSGIAEEQIRYIIENEGYKVYTDTHEQLDSDEYDPTVMEDLVSYANQAINDVSNLINTTLPNSVIGAYQGIIEQTVAKVVTGMATSDTALNETIMKWHAKGFYGFTDRAGRRQRADTYARTVIKTTTMHTYNEMRTRPAEELGIDTFYYSMKSAAREMCAPIQGQIVTTGKARTEAGHKIYALDDYGYGKPGGCRGTNCEHFMTPFIPGANYLPEVNDDLKGITPAKAIENANAQAKQRALERSIRFTKEQIHVAEKLGDMELIDRYKLKLGRQKDALKVWLDDHPFLYHDRKREKYHEDPLSFAKEEIEQRAQLAKIEKHRAEQKEMREKFFSAVESGIIKTEINNEHFERHIRGMRGYEEYLSRNIANGKQPPSYLTITKEEAESLINRYSGTGQFKYNPKATKMQEIISQNKPIGTYIDPRTGEVIENATDFRIHYSKTGSHIVPTIKGKGNRK